MNHIDPAQRSRGPPSGYSTTSNSRSLQDTRNGGPRTTGSSMTRAEKFEDEKRRIIESCFVKKEADGSVSESYITHIRILEDALHPSAPPPPQSPQENKKHRVIIVAVRKSGRVRMHKARENDNGSFSIGKSWVLDDLMAVQSYTNIVPSTKEEQDHKDRAGDVGFIVTVQKPYYWQAGTPKEKDFFIYSLIKIYKKYTGGKLPDLQGFDPHELERLTGGEPSSGIFQTRSPQSQLPNGAPPQGTSSLQGREIRHYPLREPSSRDRPSQTRPAQDLERLPQSLQVQDSGRLPQNHLVQDSQPQNRPSQESQTQIRPSRERVQTTESNDSIPRLPGSFQSSEFVRNLNPQSSQPQLRARRSGSSVSQAAHSDSSGPSAGQQEPNLRKLASTQSSESFRTRLEQQQGRILANGRSNGEHVRQTGHYTSSDTLGSASRKSSENFDRNKIPTLLRSGAQDHASNLRSQKEESRPSNTLSRLSSSQKPSEREIYQETTASAASSELRAHQEQSDLDLRSEDDRDNVRELGLENDHSQHNLNFSSRGNYDAAPEPRNDRLQSESNSATKNNIDNLPPPLHLVDRPSAESSTTHVDHNDHPVATQAINQSIAVLPVENKMMFDSKESLHSPSAEPSPDSVPEDLIEKPQHRPGLGPMLKKKSNKEISTAFRTAATAYNAFIPRAGGAAEKIRGEQGKSTDEHDGVSGVFPAPSASRGLDDLESPSVSSLRPELSIQHDMPQSQVEIARVDTSAKPPTPAEVASPIISTPETLPAQKHVAVPDPAREERRRKRRSDHSAKYAHALGISHELLEGRTFEIDTLLNESGWKEEDNGSKNFEELQQTLQKEITRAEAGSWLGVLDNSDEKVAAVGQMMDKVIAECDELDCLLTLYNVELGTLAEDVAYIEAQSQGLQVQTANQKLLHTELTTLLDTISISASDLTVLKDASLSKSEGVRAVEATLSQLYTAMLTIDPRMRQNGTRLNTSEQAGVDRSSATGFGGSELSSMRAVREKKDGYRREGKEFIQRLKQFMSAQFRETEAQIIDVLKQHKNDGKSRSPSRLDYGLREGPKSNLWLYSPLMLFTREMEPADLESMLHMYENTTKKSYLDEFRDHVASWKGITRKLTGEDEVLFTTQEKESESVVGRKLTVKRTKTVRSDGASRTSTGEKPQDGKVNAYEAFAGCLDEMTRMILAEQNFVIDFFHLASLETSDFLDAIATPLDVRKGRNPMEKKISDPDRKMAKKVMGAMEEIYTFWPNEVQNLVDWVVKQEPLQTVGVLLSLESQLHEYEETDQEFITLTLTKVHNRVTTLFGRFIEEQIRGIEETKVKIKKRKGVIAFMKTFPVFSSAVENMLPSIRNFENPPVRSMVNDAYQKLNKAMFESLKFIAKESPFASAPGVSALTGAGDPEDKEALNYHILLIENMNHYIEEVHPRSNPVLQDWKSRAARDMAEHMDLYLSAVLRRPLGKLLDFLESTESLVAHAAASGTPTPSIATRASHSRSACKKLLAAHDAREVRRGAETLRKRVEKHFGDADEAELSRALVAKVLRECEAYYARVGDRVARVLDEVYEGSLEAEWKREDVAAVLRR